ncbi:hypothetical protein BLNAU_12229 [Blattamonas nauphoetae]|uniref:Uncharacterized protein n=1 Tax=Blattamonas nauphoetae TaxID=2049346 RepID=A0ABQ9XK06_9EUKA|nr:hypothetical protein BLNAU_12229 [Blattamonas nauphoetae]
MFLTHHRHQHPKHRALLRRSANQSKSEMLSDNNGVTNKKKDVNVGRLKPNGKEKKNWKTIGNAEKKKSGFVPMPKGNKRFVNNRLYMSSCYNSSRLIPNNSQSNRLSRRNHSLDVSTVLSEELGLSERRSLRLIRAVVLHPPSLNITQPSLSPA